MDDQKRYLFQHILRPHLTSVPRTTLPVTSIPRYSRNATHRSLDFNCSLVPPLEMATLHTQYARTAVSASCPDFETLVLLPPLEGRDYDAGISDVGNKGLEIT